MQLEDERLEAELRREAYGNEVYGIGPPERLVALHEKLLTMCGGGIATTEIRHLWKLVLAEDEPAELSSLPPATRADGYAKARGAATRIGSEGYTRPATLYVEGLVQDA